MSMIRAKGATRNGRLTSKAAVEAGSTMSRSFDESRSRSLSSVLVRVARRGATALRQVETLLSLEDEVTLGQLVRDRAEEFEYFAHSADFTRLRPAEGLRAHESDSSQPILELLRYAIESWDLGTELSRYLARAYASDDHVSARVARGIERAFSGLGLHLVPIEEGQRLESDHALLRLLDGVPDACEIAPDARPGSHVARVERAPVVFEDASVRPRRRTPLVRGLVHAATP